ncbi:MAG: nucleoside-diphosphate kinase [Candidatus Cloacimonadaceae bacterium]|jgi:nucleoside-diphosphate kinase|nr:nucleoside-diphosphate kinase [Candidatus Cloacimonadaceae bacterium]
MTQLCLFLIKPNAVEDGNAGRIITMLEDDGFRVLNMKMFTFNPELSREFYAEHLGKEFYPRLESFMCSGPTIGMILEKENAIHDIRELLGDVKPENRKPGTIRALYGKGITDNGGHASDSPEHAEREIKIIFG